MTTRRHFLRLTAGAAALPALPGAALAQAYPSQPVRIVVGFAAGSGSDIFARLMGQWLSERIGQSVIVENRPGAGGNLATEQVIKAQPDGYTLLQWVPANAVNNSLYPNLNFNFLRDIAPVTGTARSPYVVVINAELPFKSIADLIAYAKANPGKLNFGSAGIGTGLHMAGELFKMMAGIDMTHVPYRGAAAAMTDLIGGRLQVMFDTTAAAIPHVKSGKVRALAMTTAARSPLLPDLPTVGDTVKGYEAVGAFGLGAPKNTPPAVIDRLNREANAALADQKVRARLAELGAEPLTGSAADIARMLAAETEKWAKVIKAANIKVEGG